MIEAGMLEGLRNGDRLDDSTKNHSLEQRT
jgi:hypothetical protein